ncbi:cytochrome c oxidase accessory protein CcoG [Rivibacter subsaxonicus]|uniref:Cytochrome c oxidase accessory protein FixG n=1 Tax=Rivibacter subsaxonicus TaxID=457575 RepID=A0A4Q7VP69_9BURK|nr:cytochrome c oxidase accessory protein CcoG [Rivibacter subsaxonicus]RZT97977.1 cytochrome c oxidase accessory protein FixG [Rivibacter subsaxonicus]
MAETPRPGARVVPIMPAAGDAAGEIVSMFQSEAKIQARAVSGRFATWRWAMVWLTQLVFYGLPWLSWNGRPAVLFDLGERRFYIFNLVLYPQDFIFLTGLLILSAYGLFLFTAVAGRLWCGYTCPQTVYTEIFMWVEHKCEGDRNARLKLDASGWTAQKLMRRGGKHLIWIAIGLWTGFTFVGYFTPIRELARGVASFGLGPWESFWILFYGFATYGNAGFMREQVCKYMCPYARFQGVMFDPDTLIISYDPHRGEPRGSRPRSTKHEALAAAGKGDCIDCTLCVQVCPTGIDIRKGLQYECIGCAACIDVCDGVMDKMEYPRGLIRYATQREIDAGEREHLTLKRMLRPRVIVYGLILAAIGSAFVASLWLRQPLRVDVVRDRGALARLVEDGRIENSYRLQLMNSTESAVPLVIEVRGIDGAQAEVRGALVLGPAESRWVPVAVQIPPQAAQTLGAGAHAIEFVVRQQGEGAHVAEKSTFIIPR